MKRLSISSIVFIFLGFLFFILNWIIDDYVKPLIILGAIFLLIGAIFCSIAISRREKGSIKYISLTSLFIVLFLVTWFEPFQVIRIITWFRSIFN